MNYKCPKCLFELSFWSGNEALGKSVSASIFLKYMSEDEALQ